MDPATVTALAALFSLAREYGPLVFVAFLLTVLVRAWRQGEFLSKGVHEQIVGTIKDRIQDWADRYKASQDGLLSWRAEAERAARAAEVSQTEHTVIVAKLAELVRELEELRGDLRDRDDRYRAPRGRPGDAAREGA